MLEKPGSKGGWATVDTAWGSPPGAGDSAGTADPQQCVLGGTHRALIAAFHATAGKCGLGGGNRAGAG